MAQGQIHGVRGPGDQATLLNRRSATLADWDIARMIGDGVGR